MQVNRYSQAADIPFMSTYVPIDFDTMYKIGTAQKQAVDDALKDLSTNLKTWSQFTSPSVVDTDNWYKLTMGQVAPIVNEMVKNPDLIKSAEGRYRLYNAINNVDYASLSKLKKGAEQLTAFNQNKARLRAAGMWNPSRNWNNKDTLNYNTLQEGILQDTSPLQYKSLGEIVRPYIEGLKPSFIAGNVNPNNPNQKLPYTKGWMAITNQDLYRTLNEKANEIIQTPQGNAWYNDIADAMQSINPDVTEKEIYQQFVNQMMQDAQYKLIAYPVDDTLAMQLELQRNEHKLENSDKSAPVLGLEDMLVKTYGDKLNSIVGTARINSKQFSNLEAEYNNSSNSEMSQFYGQLYKSNKEFATLYDKALSIIKKEYPNYPESEMQTQAANFALSNTELTENEQKLYSTALNKVSNNEMQVVDKAMGYTLQGIFNQYLETGTDDKLISNTSDQLNYEQNPFKQINVYIDGGDLMYSDAKAHDMWNKGLHALSQSMSPQLEAQVEQQMFKEKDFVSPGIGYIINPTKLMSPKEFIYNNNKHIRDLAQEANYDVLNTHLDRNTLGKDNLDIEELAAKGKFGKVSVGGIQGYIDTNGVRNYVVSVNIPKKALNERYWRWYAWDEVSNTLRNYGFTQTEGSGDDKDGMWKDGYITVDMVLPSTNALQDKTITNRYFQKEVGTTKTKESQAAIDDAMLQKFGNFEIGIGLKQ